MRAPYRRTVPWTPLPVAVNPSRRNVSRSDLQAVGDQGGAGVVMQLRPLTDEVADVGAAQIHHAHVVDVGGEPVAQIYALIDLQGVVGQGGAGVFAQFCPLTHEVADLRAGPALQYPADVLPPSAVPARRHHGRLRCVRYSASRDGRNARARRRLHRPQIRGDPDHNTAPPSVQIHHSPLLGWYPEWGVGRTREGPISRQQSRAERGAWQVT